MKKVLITPFLCFTVLLAAKGQGGSLQLFSVLQSNMVIQQNKPFTVSGFAAAGERIVVKADWLPVPVQTRAEADNRFAAVIRVPAVLKGDFTKHSLTVTGTRDSVTLYNLLIGEVWICSGQSNMQFSMRETIDSAAEEPAADHSQIRLFNGGLNFSNTQHGSMH